MSNYHSIATVTATLRDLLHQGLKDDFGSIVITAKPLDVLEKGNASLGLNIFLYQILPNNGYQNFALPNRNSKGEFIKNPIVGLNLNYLLTAYTNEISDTSLQEIQEIQTHQIIAKAMMTLNENPILDRTRILNVRNSIPILSSTLLDDHLETQLESIKFTYNPLSLDEMTKIWSSFFQIHYRLSVSYLATVVLLESQIKTKVLLPVQERNFPLFSSFGRPVIDKIEPQIVEFINNAEVKLIGKYFSGNNNKVLFDNNLLGETKLYTKSENIDTLNVKLPINLKTGIKNVQVFKKVSVDESDNNEDNNISVVPSSPLDKKDKWNSSNIATFVLAPRITTPFSIVELKRGELLPINIEPGVDENQQVRVLLDDREFKIDLPTPTPGLYPLKNLPPIQIPFDLPVTDPLPPGTPNRDPYIIRIQIDGAYSFIKKDNDTSSPTFGKYLPCLKVKE